ncbi:BTB/POZ domain-containing protein 7 [Boleophthalmus pectinirostris]|uniref:BTB/POZ domain-containing protein 7 n=1 Tax=Boleophthalmus pectinirostris TaxID=150288 RepID=UPI00243043AE|nr:BTB/POZ domain-containing protein 7 [Boleophthalmus pectinirostris]
MGANGSSYPHSCSPRIGGSSQPQQTFIGTSSYSQQGYGWESKLYSLEHGHERPADRKKKSLGLATLKRRFIKRRKSSRSADHARQMRELLSGWDVRDTNALVEEYEGTAALKELSFQASLARADAPNLQRDLAALYQHKYCTDVDLIFHGTCFPAHRAILAVRCPFFKSLLTSAPGYGAEVLMDVDTAGIDVPMFSALLQYLYTGEFGVGAAEDSRLQNVDVLVQLSEEFGTPNSLEADMKGLFDHMCYYDALLSFSSDSEMVEGCGERGAIACPSTAGSVGPVAPGTPEEDLRAHKAILSARSPFFRNLLQRRIRTGEEMTERTLHTPTRIVLDESIIPRKYVQVILHCMYTDVVELGLVLRGSPSTGSLGEVQALVSGGRGASTRTEEAMELYHIALFLEFSMLAQGCEDIIVESLSLDSLVPILKWSSQPYGSKWVHRQAMHFLCEEFSQVVSSDVLYELGKEHLLSAIQSDYLQASEQDILKYVVKWGEQQLIKRMADREPNLLSGTAHSVNKRGVKRRDLDVEELREILSPLLPFIRTEHILPPNSDVLSDALKRGLISTPPLDMLPTAEGGKANAWLRQKNAGIYVRPRLFSPYVEEAKTVLDEMMVEQTDLVRLRLVRMSNVPDTLYMVNNAVPQCCHMINHQQMTSNTASAPSVVANEIPVPQLSVVKEMIRRLQELRHTEQVQRAYALNCGEGATVSYELQLRVLREFGLADGATELLQNPYKFFPDERFGDESPILALRQVGRCRVNSSPAMDSMFADMEGVGGFHPPLPPPPPPYHPPATPSHAQMKGAWRPRVPMPTPTRSFSYPCNRTLIQRHVSSKHGSSEYSSVPRPQPPDCTNPQAMGRALLDQQVMNVEPVMREFMPDIALGVSVLSLREQHMDMDREGPHSPMGPSGLHLPHGPCPSARLSHSHGPGHGHSCKRHAPEPKLEAQAEFPDLYDFSCRPATPTSAHPRPSFPGPDLYSHSCTSGSYQPSYICDSQGHSHSQGRSAPDPLRLDVLGMTSQRHEPVLSSPSGAQARMGHVPRGRSNETDLTHGLGHLRSPSGTVDNYEDRHTGAREPAEEMILGAEQSGPSPVPQSHRNSVTEDRRSPNKPEYPYKKSAL